MATTPGPSLEPSVVVVPPLFASDDDDQSKLPTLEASVDANDTADEEEDDEEEDDDDEEEEEDRETSLPTSREEENSLVFKSRHKEMTDPFVVKHKATAPETDWTETTTSFSERGSVCPSIGI